MHRPFLLSWPLTFDTDLQNIRKNSQQPFSEPTCQDKHFEIKQTMIYNEGKSEIYVLLFE